MWMLGLCLLLVLEPYSLAEELITCAKACDGCGGSFPLDVQEIYCEMCRECGTAISTKPLGGYWETTKAAKYTTSRAPTATQSRDRRGGSGETVRRKGNYETINPAIRCNGDNKCFYLDKLSKRKIEFFCPEQVVPFCDEIEFEKKESTVAGGLSTRLLCPSSLYCKERPLTTTAKTTTTTTMAPPPPPPLTQPPPIFVPHMPPMHLLRSNMQPPHMPFFQPPMPVMMQPPPFPYYQQQPQIPPNYFPPLTPPQKLEVTPSIPDSKDTRRLAQLMSNQEGPLSSGYLEHEDNNYLYTVMRN